MAQLNSNGPSLAASPRFPPASPVSLTSRRSPCIIAGYVVLWYLVSFGGILSNKKLVAKGVSSVEPATLAFVQTISTVLLGGIANLWGRDAEGRNELECKGAKQKTSTLLFGLGWRDLGALAVLGVLRFLTVVLGLVSLKYVAASFTETVKASSPFFTVIAAYLLLGDRTPGMLLLALIPVVGGLATASATEVSFNVIGFTAAMSTNVVECIQNVLCKFLMSPSGGGGGHKGYTPSQLQYYSSVASLVVQAPMFAYEMWRSERSVLTMDLRLALLLLAGLVYYAQSSLVYIVMSHFSPVTVSVLNTIKRALIILLSIVVFQNPMTPMTQLGTGVCLAGGCLYNWLSSRQRGCVAKDASLKAH